MTKERQELLDYVTLMNGARLYLLPLTQQDLQLKRAEAEKEFSTREIEQPWYYTVEPDEKGHGGERVLWTRADVLKDGSDEEKASWLAYERNQAEKSQFVEDVVFRFILIEGTSRLTTAQGNEVDLVIDPVTGEWTPPPVWKARLNGYISDDPYELKHLFLAGMVKDAETASRIVSRGLALAMKGMITEEDALRWEAIFQRQMAKEGRRFDALIAEFESGNEAREGGALDIQLQDDGTANSQRLGTDTKPVGRSRKER